MVREIVGKTLGKGKYSGKHRRTKDITRHLLSFFSLLAYVATVFPNLNDINQMWRTMALPYQSIHANTVAGPEILALGVEIPCT